jgi:hypothetical protein
VIFKRADHAADEAGALPEMIPSHGLTEPGRNERADDSQNRRQDEPFGLGLVARHDELRDQSNDKSDEDRPKDAHVRRSVCASTREGMRERLKSQTIPWATLI